MTVNPNQALWEKGDFTRIAETMRESGEALVKGLGITKGLKVLDLGCGDGTTALPAAQLGANVSGDKISFARDTYTFNFPGTPVEFVDAFRRYYGPTMNAFDAAEKNGRAEDLRRELEAIFTSQNKSSNESSTSISAAFLRVTVSR